MANLGVFIPKILFSSFQLHLQVLQKIIQDQATCVVVVPDWPTQAWYPLPTSLLILPPVKLYPSKNLLRLPATPATVHPLHKNMSLLICLLSSNNLQDKDLLNVVLELSLPPGVREQLLSTSPT